MRIVRCLFVIYLKKEKRLLIAFFTVFAVSIAVKADLTTVGF